MIRLKTKTTNSLLAEILENLYNIQTTEQKMLNSKFKMTNLK